MNDSPRLCAAATSSSDHSVNINSVGCRARPSCSVKTREKCIVAECGSTLGSQLPSTGSWRPQSPGCGWLGSGGSWRGHTPPGQTCGCWTCGPPLCAACQLCHLHPGVSTCHVEATAYKRHENFNYWTVLWVAFSCNYLYFYANLISGKFQN